MIPLVLGEKEKQDLRRLKEYAEANFLSAADMQLMERTGKAVGDNPNFVVNIPIVPGGSYYRKTTKWLVAGFLALQTPAITV